MRVNFAMFVVEVVSGIVAGSVSLLADSVDFIGDAANYGISLFVLGMGLAARARASLLKAFSMAAFGIGVLGCALWHAFDSTTPSAPTMGAVGTLALAANCGVALLLYAHRDGDSNRRSVWLCTRNDALAPGSSYPAITALVNVAPNAAASADFRPRTSTSVTPAPRAVSYFLL